MIFTELFNALTKMGPVGLFILAFIESIFFPIPPDAILIILVVNNPLSWWWLPLISGVGSVMGAITGYFIGRYGGYPLIKRFFSQRTIKKVHNLFEKYEVGAIFIAGFTPIPYKVFTISAGLFFINFWKFIIASFISRTARFLLVGGITAYIISLGIKISLTIINLITIALVLAAIEYWLAKKIWFL